MTVITALQRLRQEDKVLPELHGETLSQKNKTNKQKKKHCIEILPHPSQNGCLQENKQQMMVRLQGERDSYTLLMGM
jgi:hypothetical protein